jgi:hypothetical protein
MTTRKIASFTFKNLKITKKESLKGAVPPWSDGHDFVIKYQIHVSDENGNSFSFDFYGSINEYKNVSDPRKRGTEDAERFSKYNVINAAYCGLSDALFYADTRNIDDFANELGYTKISEAIRAYDGCKEAFGNWSCLNVDDLYDLANEMGEHYA